MNKLHTLIRVGVVVAAIPAARAALQFTQVSSSGDGQKDTTVHVLIDGDRFRATMDNTNSQFPPPGSYVLGVGGGKMYLVFPANQAYAEFNRDQLAGMGQQGSDSMKNAKAKQAQMGMSTTLQNFKFEKVLDEAGPQMLGYPTRHYRYVLSYKEVTEMKGAPKAMSTSVEDDYEFWSTKEIGEMSKVIAELEAMHPRAMHTGDEAADRTAEAEKVMWDQGMQLKSIKTHKASMGGMMGFMGALGRLGRSKGGGGSTSMEEIVALDHVNAPRDAFELPKDFQQVDMMSLFTAASGQMPDLNSLPRNRPQQQPPKMPDLNSQ